MSQNAVVIVVMAVIVVGRFLVRELRERKFVTNRIYVLPAIVGAVALALIGLAASRQPDAVAALALACLVSLAAGGAFGFAVAHFTSVRVTSEPGIIYARGSYITAGLWVAALMLRLGARYVFAGAAGGMHAATLSLSLNAALLVLLASALFFVRYRLLEAAKIERARGITAPSPAI